MNKTDGVTFLGFEGPEKRLEVNFKQTSAADIGLRAITKDEWQLLLDEARCTIISQKSNDFFDSYVLSESSLFVWSHKMVIKTCGTTTLLKILPKLSEYATQCNLEFDLVVYSRKSFVFPTQQEAPHTDWENETEYLDNHFTGRAYTFGPNPKEQWFLYIADYTGSDVRRIPPKELTFEIMMHHLEPVAAQQFYRKPETQDRDPFPGVADLIPFSETDEFNFTPCGYSMNGLADSVYYTIHVTPEPHCSYASFETNIALADYRTLIQNVFKIFRPGSVTLSLLTEKSSVEELASMDMEIPGYTLTHNQVCGLVANCEVMVLNYHSLHHARKGQHHKQ